MTVCIVILISPFLTSFPNAALPGSLAARDKLFADLSKRVETDIKGLEYMVVRLTQIFAPFLRSKLLFPCAFRADCCCDPTSLFAQTTAPTSGTVSMMMIFKDQAAAEDYSTTLRNTFLDQLKNCIELKPLVLEEYQIHDIIIK
eukprot:SAG31_NODE_508_length_14732_cov_75.624547_14_plen_144_part_00